ncbi:nuclear transport factor 2 family protein [Halostreptopolyspora alba]|uniref:nuclear transport factor 2 family protein n=1 Tax=Halostreptopolyspora alba TaxID=2487137 RepID=UPI00267ABA1E
MTDPSTVRHYAENLIHTYATLADGNDAEALGALLADAELVFDGGAPVKGRDAITDLYRRAGKPGVHLVTNLVVEHAAEDGRVEATARYSRWELRPRPRPTALGRYRFRLTGAGRDWRIARLNVVREWQEHQDQRDSR